MKRNSNINSLIIKNAKLLQADNKIMKEALLDIHARLSDDSIFNKEYIIEKIEKILDIK